MNVLSLFDGISCGQIALNRSNIKYNKYFASEIDKNAIKVTMNNYPNTIQLGDIRYINGYILPKIDLLIGGSPCQGFSFAGKQLNFNDPRSKLFFEYIRLLKECKPKFFLLENVKMTIESQNIISRYLDVEPIEINSALVSAQNRVRLYWTNIPYLKKLIWTNRCIIEQPKDKNIYLKDILEKDKNILKKYKVPKTKSRIEMWEGKCKNITHEKKASCVVTKQDRWNSQGLIEFEDFCRFLTPIENERLQTLPDNYTIGIADTQRDFVIGNGWTVDVIAHIFNYLKFTKK
jgi:DNA-cytosine methyltransferase